MKDTQTETSATAATPGLPELPVLDRLMELGAMKAKVFQSDGGEPFMVIPGNCKLADLSAFAPPQRIKQRVTLLEVTSFTDYVNRFKTPETQIFALMDPNGARFLAALDYHHAAPELTPGRSAHCASYPTMATPEWQRWTQQNGVEMDQATFAGFLEDNKKQLVEPSGAVLLELVETLHGKNNVKFTSEMRTNTGGTRLHYETEVSLRGGAAGGEVELPREIRLGIAPFVGGALYSVAARLRYRIANPGLVLWYEILGMENILRDSVLDLTKLIAEKTGIVPYLGSVQGL